MAQAGQVAGAIRSITESATKVKTLVDEVNLGSQEQARGIEQIAKAIGQMEQVTQKNAANAQQSASAGEELSAQVGNGAGHREPLQALVGGADRVRRPPRDASGLPRRPTVIAAARRPRPGGGPAIRRRAMAVRPDRSANCL